MDCLSNLLALMNNKAPSFQAMRLSWSSSVESIPGFKSEAMKILSSRSGGSFVCRSPTLSGDLLCLLRHRVSLAAEGPKEFQADLTAFAALVIMSFVFLFQVFWRSSVAFLVARTSLPSSTIIWTMASSSQPNKKTSNISCWTEATEVTLKVSSSTLSQVTGFGFSFNCRKNESSNLCTMFK